VIIVVVLIWLNRYYYTNVLRNKRYWNKQIFEGKYGKIPIPLCPNTVQDIYDDATYVKDQVQSGMASGSSLFASAVQSVADDAQDFADSTRNMSEQMKKQSQKK
jgi:hypothetical protein